MCVALCLRPLALFLVEVTDDMLPSKSLHSKTGYKYYAGNHISRETAVKALRKIQTMAVQRLKRLLWLRKPGKGQLS